MTTAETVALGAIAGFTIFLGLPAGRLGAQARRLKTFLSGISAGILVFLLFEVLHKATEFVEEGLEHAREGEGTWGAFAGMTLVYVGGVAAGLLSLYYVGRAWSHRRSPPSLGPGAMAADEIPAAREAMRLGMSIAVGIGLHNFSEGLAIGQSAAAGDVSLALLLVIGFGLHNATEGFGIVGPLAGQNLVAPWRWLIAAGFIAGSPTFVGTVIGRTWTSDYLTAAFLAMAGGAIVYVLAELFASGRKLDWELMLWGTLAGILLGVGTELVLVVAGI